MSKPGADTSSSRALANYIAELQGQSRPARRLGFQQGAEALRTGGVGARIPIIQRAVEASKLATSNALQGTESGAAAAGVSGPYLQSILAATREQGGLATSRIPTDDAQRLIGMVFPASVQSGSTAIAGLGNAAASAANVNAANNTAQATEIGGGAAAVGAIAAAAIIA